jgi:hypothetical protein
LKLVALDDGRSEEATREERERLNLECKAMLEKLEEIDPMRANRYRDIGESFSFSPFVLFL